MVVFVNSSHVNVFIACSCQGTCNNYWVNAPYKMKLSRLAFLWGEMRTNHKMGTLTGPKGLWIKKLHTSKVLRIWFFGVYFIYKNIKKHLPATRTLYWAPMVSVLPRNVNIYDHFFGLSNNFQPVVAWPSSTNSWKVSR